MFSSQLQTDAADCIVYADNFLAFPPAPDKLKISQVFYSGLVIIFYCYLLCIFNKFYIVYILPQKEEK